MGEEQFEGQDNILLGARQPGFITGNPFLILIFKGAAVFFDGGASYRGLSKRVPG